MRSKRKTLLQFVVLAAIAICTLTASAQNAGAGVPDYEALASRDNYQFDEKPAEKTPVDEDAGSNEPFLNADGKPILTIRNIHPAHGPVTGNTKVTVRADKIARYEKKYPQPKCRFGSNSTVVNADWITCTTEIEKVGEREAAKNERKDTCIVCDGAPSSLESRPVEFQVSLIGDFSDVTSSANYYYYKASRVAAIKPIHGPKDGGTNVQVWGENFVEFGDETRCTFGTKSVKATVHAPNYITCTAPPSDVVNRAMPFGVTLNGQQQSVDRIDYWYYNNPQVVVVEPASGPGPGPESGGNEVVLRGSNFLPFHTDQDEPDISNSTQCAFTLLNVWVPAVILNSTRAVCVAPPSYYYKQTPVELTLNAQDWTDDGTLYFYYKPPFLFDAQPRQGPLQGNTIVTVVGSNFNNTGNITCRFGHISVPGKLKSSSEIVCTSPAVTQAGSVDLAVSLLPGLYSSPVSFLYYQAPIVSQIEPTCGPESGFTQIQVTGTNFVDLGGDQALCVFNRSIFTNATVMSDSTLICNSPSLLNKQGYSEVPDGVAPIYIVEVSLDGGLEMSGGQAIFSYYREPIVTHASPSLGPLKAGTIVKLHGSGFTQATAAGGRKLVRLGHVHVEPTSVTNDTITFEAPPVLFPSTTVIGVSLNGQQFTGQSNVHAPSKSVTFDYYREPYVSVHYPGRGPTNGGTLLRAQGFGFTLSRPHLTDHLWVRFVDANSRQELSASTQVAAENLRSDSFAWKTPAVANAASALLQVSLNNVDWHDVKDPSRDFSFSYYASPHVVSVSPSFGHVKAAREQVVELKGSGFECFDSECSELKCRFGNRPDAYIFTQGELVSSETVRCKVPEYTKPDVLEVELTINGESFTSDNQTYGFFDPFVLDAVPRLIATDGSTTVAIEGIGFVNSGQEKAIFSNRTHQLHCGEKSSECSKIATFKDKRTLITSTWAQSAIKYRDSDKSVMWDPIYVDATVIGDEFTENEVELFYYEDPTLSGTNIGEAPANLQAQLIITAEFGTNNKAILQRYATPKCRFTAGSKVETTDAQLVAYPFTTSRDPSLINAFHCKTPRWDLKDAESEQATISVSLNGQNFVYGLDFTFRRPLRIHRDVAMAGPKGKASMVKTVGQGYRLQSREADIKWGTQATEGISAGHVNSYTYNTEDFLNTVAGGQELRGYLNEARNFPRVDSVMTEGSSIYDEVSKPSLLSSDTNSLGGPAYLEVGLDEVLQHAADGGIPQQWILYNYEPSSVEFYSFKEPNVLRMHPTAGLTRGGTFVEVIGTWFRYMPEYGIIPHCRFGDKIVRAHFDSSVRLVCQSPANSDVSAKLSFEISMNGVDWTSTGFHFSYYEEPIMTDIYPDMGSVAGGDEIFIKGERFTNNTDPNEFKCRFTPVSLSIPPKTIRARFINSTSIMCPSPGGWSEADRMVLQVTWNGVDYDENHFQYSFYSIHNAFPRSGPSNGHGGDIIVRGQGFRIDTNPSCMLNGTQWEPTFVNATQIRCPMPPAQAGDTYFGNVDFSVTANGISWNPFEGGFQYYEQPIVEDIDPKKGPSSGVGIINFYGSGFRADYPLAQLGCKLGDAQGRAYYVSPRQVKCVVEDIPLLSEDDDPLPAQVSLNSYSFTDLGEDTYYRPYGVLQISPNSIPVGATPTIVVTGKGFIAEEGVTPRCRFGTPAAYSISPAEILSYNRLACRAPESIPGSPTASLPRDVPFSVALSGDEFAPWTASTIRAVYYEQPSIQAVDPIEVDVGRIVAVYVTASDDSEFFDPVSVVSQTADDEHRSTVLSPLKCRFGRFGETNAVFVNSTTIKCTTPPTDESPDSIYRETITVSVSMNGVDFNEDQSEVEFTFVGTAPYISFLTIILTLLAIAFVGFAITLCTNDAYRFNQMSYENPPWAGNSTRANTGGVNLRDPAGGY